MLDLCGQGGRALDRSQGGLGIGLTLVKRLAELHGGVASVASEGSGKGSEFTVCLPAVGPPDGAERPEASEAAPAARHILVVEDSADARETLVALLETHGHRVDSAADGATGLERALALQPDIVLLDIGLPVLDGYEVARRIRASHGIRRPLIVAITGYGTPEDRDAALLAGFDAHITKPVEYATLAALIAGADTATA